MTTAATGKAPPRIVSDRSLAALAALNFFLADARDGLGPFLDAFLAINGWSPLTLGLIATVGGLIGLQAMPLCGALVDASSWKRSLAGVPVILVTLFALVTLLLPNVSVVWIGQIGTAVVGPALTGLTLGLVGERLFSQQIRAMNSGTTAPILILCLPSMCWFPCSARVASSG